MPWDERSVEGYEEEASGGENRMPPDTSSSPPISDVSSVERERDEYLDLAKRTKAEFENYRKRVAREAAEAEIRGRGELARDLVPVIDNLERALAAALARAGVESYAPEGEEFDPDWHEAMLTRPGEVGQVLEVLEKGYRLNG